MNPIVIEGETGHKRGVNITAFWDWEDGWMYQESMEMEN